MKIPKSIEKLIEQRENYAYSLLSSDCKLSQWLEKNEIETEEYDTRGGCEMYVNPSESAERIRQAISGK